MRFAPAAVCAAALASLAQAQYLMIPDSSANDRVMLFSAADGSIVNLDFITDAGGQFNFQTPKEAEQVGNEIWVSDQISDSIFRFTASLTPAYIGTITGGMDNLRGLGVVGDRVFVANAGTGNGAPGDAVLRFTLDGTPDGSFPYNDPFDCTAFNGKVLVPDGIGDDISLFNPDGTLDSVFHASDGTSGIDFPEQLTVANTGPAGAQEVWAAGFSAPIGIYRYDAAGAQVAYYAMSTAGNRGVFPLANGNVMLTFSSTVAYFTPPATTLTTIISSGIAAQYINFLDLTNVAACDPDFTCDGNADQDDVACLIDVVAGNPGCECQDPDFNQDGNVDQDDVGALINVVAGGPCP